jgi:antitoxin (DNA-binding transcriptional repressor) of toxin-antitoxin stability system
LFIIKRGGFYMEQVNIHVAKTRLSALVARAAAGELFVIAKAGRPLVTVSPFNAAKPLPRIGFMRADISIPDDFDRMGEQEITAMFEGSEEKGGDKT